MDYTKAIMGENSVHLPFNFIRMKMGNKVGLVFRSRCRQSACI